MTEELKVKGAWLLIGGGAIISILCFFALVVAVPATLKAHDKIYENSDSVGRNASKISSLKALLLEREETADEKYTLLIKQISILNADNKILLQGQAEMKARLDSFEAVND